MTGITIRNLDDEVMTRLRVCAAEHQRSLEEEERIILRDAVSHGRAGPRNLANVHARVLRAPWRRGTGSPSARPDVRASGFLLSGPRVRH